MSNILAVALGGACGAVLRYLVVGAAGLAGVSWPAGTLIVNVAGSFLVGFLVAFWTLTGIGPGTTRLLFQTGMLGAFTTFSAFSLDTMGLWQGGQFRLAALNVVLNVSLCLVAVAVGGALGSGTLWRAS